MLLISAHVESFSVSQCVFVVVKRQWGVEEGALWTWHLYCLPKLPISIPGPSTSPQKLLGNPAGKRQHVIFSQRTWVTSDLQETNPMYSIKWWTGWGPFLSLSHGYVGLGEDSALPNIACHPELFHAYLDTLFLERGPKWSGAMFQLTEAVGQQQQNCVKLRYPLFCHVFGIVRVYCFKKELALAWPGT